MTKDEQRVYSRNYYKIHKEQIIARQREIRLKEPERIRNYRNKEHAQSYQKAYALSHSEKRKAYSRQYSLENGEKRKTYRVQHRSEVSQYNRQYLLTHSTQIQSRRHHNHQDALEKHRRYNEEHRDSLKAWRLAHPEQARLARSRRRAKMNGTVSQEEWNGVQAFWNYRCAYCGDRTKLSIDHIVPIAHGGRHTVTNLAPACRRCNSRKGTKLWIPLKAL